MKLKVKGNSLYQDGKHHAGDAGIDVITNENPIVSGIRFDTKRPYIGTLKKGMKFLTIDYIQYNTETSIDPSELDAYVLIYPRSSISEKNLVLANSVGVVDTGFRGNICFRFKYIIQPMDIHIGLNKEVSVIPNLEKIYKKGDRVGQIVPMKHFEDFEIEFTEELSDSTRGNGGFGSTGQ